MKHSEFIGKAQQRTEFGQRGHAVRATRAVLWTLGERLPEGDATDLASPLPVDIDFYLRAPESGQQFGFDEFVDRVGERADADESDATFYAQAIVSLVAEVVPEGELEDVRSSLPDEYDPLFELVGVDEQAIEQNR
ncbi:DUF2267 domain-containing protein [Natronoarchaeum mannanilyticum]|uniref:DUF2267 domain-containing protein n=1 Tax=Natronoarchaeum mannanilyticum TaxID=926360 RepID=A0AAV3TAU5_9EURY